MIWLLLLVAVTISVLGAVASAAVVTTARAQVAEAISRRLRGSDDSFHWLAITQRQVASATAAISLGVALIGAVVPGVFTGFSVPQLALFLLVIVVPVTLVGAYLLPRSLTVPRAARAAQALRPVLQAWTGAIGLVLPARNADAASDLRDLAREGIANGMSDGDELVMVGGVMTFAERPVRAVMTPRTEVIAVAHDASYATVFEVFAESGYTRLPMYRDTLDDIVGMVHAFDLFKLNPDDAVPVRAVAFAPESRLAGDLLIDMQRERRHFAVVLDEFGGTAGVVTLEDLLEALVGEISDEDDPSSPAPVVAGAPLEIDGTATLPEVAEHFGLALPRSDAASFAGLVAELAGRIPATGERFVIRGLEVDILQASPTRIARILVRRGGASPTVLDGGDR